MIENSGKSYRSYWRLRDKFPIVAIALRAVMLSC